jgi:hypothetical protein
MSFLPELSVSTPQSIPSVPQSISSATQSIPSATQSIPSATQSISSATQSIPSATQSIPSATQSIPSATQSIPSATQSISSATQSIPSATQSISSATQSISSATQSIPSATQSIPSATQSISSATQSIPSATPSVPSSNPTLSTALPLFSGIPLCSDMLKFMVEFIGSCEKVLEIIQYEDDISEEDLNFLLDRITSLNLFNVLEKIMIDKFTIPRCINPEDFFRRIERRVKCLRIEAAIAIDSSKYACYEDIYSEIIDAIHSFTGFEEEQKLEKLQELYLSETQIQCLRSSNHSELQTLYLCGNTELCSISGRFLKLRKFNFTSDKFVSLDGSDFPKLEKLDLQGPCELKGVFPSLKKLSIQRTSFKVLEGACFPKLKKLTIFNELKFIELVGNFPCLEQLDISACDSFSEIDGDNFPKLKKLKISALDLFDESEFKFRHTFPELLELEIDLGTPITTLDGDMFPRLESLNFRPSEVFEEFLGTFNEVYLMAFRHFCRMRAPTSFSTAFPRLCLD